MGPHKADLLDPTVNPSRLADVDFDAEPTPRDLAPFMGEWSATEPIKAYRSEQTRQRYADIRAHQKSWHHGMRGNPRHGDGAGKATALATVETAVILADDG